MFASINGAVFWFAAIEPNLGARIYVMNIGYGALFLAAFFRLRRLAEAGTADRVLFWALTLFAVHFPVRTILTSDARFAQIATEFSRTPFWTFLHLSLAVFGVGLVLALLAATVSDMLSRLRRERDHDPLTGLLNRGGFDRSSGGKPAPGACVALVDIDHFKSINDRHGHATGDAVLRHVAAVLQASLADRGLLARIGGEEFALVIPAATPRSAVQLCETLRAAVVGSPLTDPPRLSATASFGVATTRADETVWEALARADAALYRAKAEGRDRVVLAEGPDTSDIANASGDPPRTLKLQDALMIS